MSQRIGQPINQVRLTNVAIVRLQKAGKRFEIACYRNKVVNWRNKVETDINEVLQIDNIFQNVSKGVLAKQQDLQKAFGTTETEVCCRIILEGGELQVSDREREAHQENLLRDIATIVTEKCVNPESNRPYTVSMISNAMKEIHFSVIPNRSAKQQALEVIHRLKKIMPIERAKMHLRIIATTQDWAAIKEKLNAVSAQLLSSEESEPVNKSADFLIDPGYFRIVTEAVQEATRGSGRVDVVQLSVQQEGEAVLDEEIAQREIRAKASLLQKQQAQLDDTPKETAVVISGTSCSTKQSTNQSSLACEDHSDNEGPGGIKKKKNQQRKSKAAKRRDRELLKEQEEQLQEVLARETMRRLKMPSEKNEETATSENDAYCNLPPPPPSATQQNGSSAQSCNTCGGNFLTPAEHRAHFRSNWHRYNLKLKMKGGQAISEDEFNQFDAKEMFMIGNNF